jgi:trk system potassium uptake protein TrkA
MFILVVGGGKVGYYLVQSLLHIGHEVAVIEKVQRKNEQIMDDFGIVAITGDGCDPRILEEAGAGRADVIVAGTGDDEDNLVICQVAKLRFQVPQTIARVNNPKNEMIFRKLGIDATVSSTDLVLSMIEQEVVYRGMTPIIAFRKSGMEIVETVLPPESPVLGKTLKEIPFPAQCRLLAVLRGEQLLVPDGETQLLAQDLVFSLVSPNCLDEVERLLVGNGEVKPLNSERIG